jgi:tagatose 1,6-diphosphate aldolase
LILSGNPTRRFHGVAVDAGSGLDAAIKAARGSASRPDDLLRFKRAVLTTLGPHATTVLVDAAYGPDLLADYPPGCLPMMAFEADVYRISDVDRMTVLPDHLSIADFQRLKVKHLKFFMYYAPDDDPAINARKEALTRQVGAECAANGLHFLMEPLVYHPQLTPGTAEFARAKPELVARAVEVFSASSFNVDTLKIEVPVDFAFVEGFGKPQMSRAQALAAFRAAAASAGPIPLVYLSAGVPFDWFEASLKMAREAGVTFSGFMCGRSIWWDAIAVFGAKGETAMQDWLAEAGLGRLRRLIAAMELG